MTTNLVFQSANQHNLWIQIWIIHQVSVFAFAAVFVGSDTSMSLGILSLMKVNM